MSLSPLMSIAGAGFLNDPPPDIGVALATPTDLSNAVSSYSSVDVVALATSVKYQALDLVVIPPVAANAEITLATYLSLLDLGNDVIPALTDCLPGPMISPPSGVPPGGLAYNGLTPAWSDTTEYAISDIVAYQGEIYVAVDASKNVAPDSDTSKWKIYVSDYTMTGTITQDTAAVVDTSDPSKFCQIFMAAMGYISQANATLNSLNNSKDLAETFNPEQGGMDVLSTGGLSLVSRDIPALSQDLRNLGQAISLANLDDLGLPGELLAQMGRVSGGLLPGLSDFLLASDVSQSSIDRLNNGDNRLTNQEERNAYSAMLAVTGDLLNQVKSLLGITTENLTNMAQILDPKYALPRSYTKLQCPTPSGLAPVYLLGSEGSVQGINNELEPLLENRGIEEYTGPNNTNSLTVLKTIIPQDAAIANKALARSLGQVKNISAMQLPQLAEAMAAVRPLTGLTEIASLTEPIPVCVTELYKQELGTGSGPGGTLTLTDILGVVDNSFFVESLDKAACFISQFDTQDLQDIFQEMLDVIAAPTPPITIASGPAAGEYDSVEGAFTGVDSNPLAGIGLLPAADDAVGNVAAAYPEETEVLNDIWRDIASKVSAQQSNQVRAEIDFDEITGNSTSSVMIFTANLHEYGVNEDAAKFLGVLANSSTLSGQALTGSLREGQNIAALQDAGVGMDTQLPSTRRP